jgi:pimeloyl-ACP methyl ester carboxylesterase
MALQPTARLSFRTQPSGGAIQPEPDEAQYRAIVARRALLLIIHGYNNNLTDSEDAYRGFERMQRELAGLDDDMPVAGGKIVQVYWPGDADWGIMSPLYYPWSIERACDTAKALARVLARAAREGGHKQIDVVAHSMGSRLAMELLRELQDVADVTVGRLVLMAGAVPTFMLEPKPDKRKLRAAFDTVLADAGMSLYSDGDMVLAMAFPLGQSIAPGEEGFFPTALGHERCADAPARMTQDEIAGAGHSDYWGWRDQDDARGRAHAANAKIRTFLRLEPLGARTIEERETVERETLGSREAGAARETAGYVDAEWPSY